jgi:hypothetical protein
MEEYNVLPDNTYNMEKGFLLGKITKAKWIFLKDLKTSRKILRAGQDGSIFPRHGLVCSTLLEISDAMLEL